MNATDSTASDDIAQEFIQRHGDDCSYVLIRWWQVLWYGGILAIFLLGLVYRWDIVLFVVNTMLALWYFGIVLFKMLVVCTSLAGLGQIKVKQTEIEALTDDDLPLYTILVPLYKEANITDRIVRSLNKLDYPKKKLDIKLLLESDDTETINAVNKTKLDDHYDVIVVPDSQPKTKPKACNYGLKRAKGDFCVIFDAEDQPDPDQLKKVVIAFRKLPPNIACIQAKLNYYNARQNLLTRWFTIEYSTTFDLYLPGLQCAGIPIPLGGTSNHFRTPILKELEGWDPFNVTEDCDLGVRLYRLGYKTMMIDSTTWEEANSRLWNWIRQRSRWVKGFFQTHLTHTRNPIRILKQLGLWGYLGFILCVGG
ncbi:MAG: glycosyltransferase, partial [Lentisphaerae bacterium]|nr:glycosyltransferase [Lentisphaerota bacterium]